MGKLTMEAALTFATREGGLAHAGTTFEAANEEDARLYEERGLARKKKDIKPSRTQDVQAEPKEERKSPKRGRPPKKRQTKADTEE